jgi:hypothetical protein
VSEADLHGLIVEAAGWLNWWVYHTHDSRRSQPGWPDLVLVHRDTGHVLFRELKSERGRLTAEQREVLGYLALRHDAGVWRPSDWSSGAVLAQLRARRGAAA